MGGKVTVWNPKIETSPGPTAATLSGIPGMAAASSIATSLLPGGRSLWAAIKKAKAWLLLVFILGFFGGFLGVYGVFGDGCEPPGAAVHDLWGDLEEGGRRAHLAMQRLKRGASGFDFLKCLFGR